MAKEREERGISIIATITASLQRDEMTIIFTYPSLRILDRIGNLIKATIGIIARIEAILIGE